MILEENSEGPRSATPHPEVPKDPDGFALNVQEGQPAGTMRVRSIGFPLQNYPAGPAQFRGLIEWVALDESQQRPGFVRIPNQDFQGSVSKYMDVGPKFSAQHLGYQGRRVHLVGVQNTMGRMGRREGLEQFSIDHP